MVAQVHFILGQMRSTRRRHNPSDGPSAGTIALIAGGAVGAILLIRWVMRSQPQPTVGSGPNVGSLPFPGGLGGQQPTAGGSGGQSAPPINPYESVGGNVSTQDRIAAIAARLQGNPAALQLYAFQALAYETRLTDALPDGLMGPVTSQVISSLQQRDNLPITGTFDPSLISAIVDVTGYTAGASLRPLPDALPDAIVSQLNAFIASQVPDNAPQIFSRSVPA